MSTTTAIEKPSTTKEAKEPCLIYELARTQKSSWRPNVKKGNNRMKDIKSAKWLNIDVRSRYDGGPGVGLVRIQYVAGAPTIRYDDYKDEKGVQQKGLVSLYGREHLDKELFRQSTLENIKFVDGILFLDHWGGASNTALIDYIAHHEFNQAAPNFKVNRNMNTIFLFKPLEVEKKAAIDLDTIDEEMNAMKVLDSLSEKTKSGRTYDIPKINAILGALQEGGGLGENESASKVLLIRSFVHRNPSAFLKVYTETLAEYEAKIKVATKLKIVSFTEGSASIKIEGIEPYTCEVKGAGMEGKIESLTFYFLGTQDGDMIYSQLQSEIERKKIEALNK